MHVCQEKSLAIHYTEMFLYWAQLPCFFEELGVITKSCNCLSHCVEAHSLPKLEAIRCENIKAYLNCHIAGDVWLVVYHFWPYHTRIHIHIDHLKVARTLFSSEQKWNVIEFIQGILRMTESPDSLANVFLLLLNKLKSFEKIVWH
jgi:hypothetical protein